MHRRVQRWTLLKLANLAGVGHKVAYEARDRSILLPEILTASDVLPLRTFDALRRVSWPQESCARNTPHHLRLWEALAIEQSRIDVETVSPMTGMYVHPAGAELAVCPSHHAVIPLQLAESHSPHVYLPLGMWARQARRALGLDHPSRPPAPKPMPRAVLPKPDLTAAAG
jgi:hypothetical protein